MESSAAGGAEQPSQEPDAVDELLHKVEMTAAAVAGALEGYRTRVHEEHLGEELGEAARVAREFSESPEMQRMGHAISERGARARSAASERVEHARNTSRDATARARERGTHARDSVRHTAEDVRRTTRDAYHRAEERVGHAVEDVQRKGSAVAESGRRASRAPSAVWGDVSRGMSEMMSRWGKAFAIALGSTVFAITAFILLTIFLVVALNGVLGDPWGTLIVALLWGAVTAAALYQARNYMSQATDARSDMRQRVREDIDYVKRPVRREFGARRARGT